MKIRIPSFAGACMFFCDDTQIRPIARAPITVLFGLSDSGFVVDLTPIMEQRLSDIVQPRLFVAVFALLVTDHLLCRHPIAGGERLIPAVVTELGRQEIGVLQGEVRSKPWRHAHYAQL